MDVSVLSATVLAPSPRGRGRGVRGHKHERQGLPLGTLDRGKFGSGGPSARQPEKPRWSVALPGKTRENWQCMYETDI